MDEVVVPENREIHKNHLPKMMLRKSSKMANFHEKGHRICHFWPFFGENRSLNFTKIAKQKNDRSLYKGQLFLEVVVPENHLRK